MHKSNKTKKQKSQKGTNKNHKLTFWLGLTSILLSAFFILSILLEYFKISFTSKLFSDPFHVMIAFLIPIFIVSLATILYYTLTKEKSAFPSHTGVILGIAGILSFSVFNIVLYFVEKNLRFEFLFIPANVILISIGALALSLIINKAKSYKSKKSPEKNEELSFFFGKVSTLIAVLFASIVLIDYFLIYGLTNFSIMHLFLIIFSKMSIIFILFFTLSLISSITAITYYKFSKNKKTKKAFLGLSLAVFGIVFFLGFIFMMYSTVFF
ncbi:MAG: hypothetical protein ACOCQG_01860 [Candidatus Nanoarchaeia archaeon]